MSDIWMDMLPFWCDGQVIHVADMWMDCLRQQYNGQMVDATDIRTDASCWWYARQIVDANDIWYGRQGSCMFQLNHACGATPPQSTLVEALGKFWIYTIIGII